MSFEPRYSESELNQISEQVGQRELGFLDYAYPA